MPLITNPYALTLSGVIVSANSLSAFTIGKITSDKTSPMDSFASPQALDSCAVAPIAESLITCAKSPYCRSAAAKIIFCAFATLPTATNSSTCCLCCSERLNPTRLNAFNPLTGSCSAFANIVVTVFNSSAAGIPID